MPRRSIFCKDTRYVQILYNSYDSPADRPMQSQDFYKLVRNNTALQSTVFKLAFPDSAHDMLNATQRSVGMAGSTTGRLLDDRRDTKAHEDASENEDAVTCICKPTNQTEKWRPMALTHFSRAFKSSYYSFCPKYAASEQSLELKMKIIPAEWLLARTINFSLQIRYWQTSKRFSISRPVIGTSRPINSMESPGF